ncbi:DUF4012 domain-containing protein [bacterium]|nr:DUF4012 domain-containing protein [bacterium]
MRKYSVKFWITFWSIAVILLAGWYFFCEVKNRGMQSLEPAVNSLPVSQETKDCFKAAAYLSDEFLKNDGQEKIFLVLFQNNLEIRPGGGFIGSFGILKVKNKQVVSFGIHDTGNFDGRIPNIVKPPYPMEKTLRIKSWKFRDSNYSPDFKVNAEKAREFYYMGGGEEEFDGIIAITANVLASFLKITGPITIEGYPGIYNSDNAVISLEHQVEKDYAQQGIEKGERKSVMSELGGEIIKRISAFNSFQKIKLVQIVVDDLNRKDVQLYFKKPEIQEMAENLGWAGRVNEDWKQDYLMAVDANLGAYKSDYYVKRSIDYSVDLTKEKPEAVLKITYNHTARQKDWMTKDYLTYLRVYAPKGSWLNEYKNSGVPRFGSEFGKKYFGFLVGVPLGQSKTIEVRYSLPENLKENYNLLIQKQAGINNMPVKINIKPNNGAEENYDIMLNKDFVLEK